MLRTIAMWIGILVAGAGYLAAAQQRPSNPPPSVASHRAVLNRYCVTCHNEKLKTAGLMLDKLDLEDVPAGAQTWEKVIRKLRAGAMPPAGVPRPDQPTSDALAKYLEVAIDRAAAAKPDPGRPAIHRLNRAEYTNAIRDLLAVDIDGRSLLPADDSGYGFDNMADVLSVSPMLLERYVSAAGKISRLAIGDTAIRPALATYDVEQFLIQQDRASEDLPFGSRGGIAIRHFFPLDGDYTLKIRLQGNNGRIIGLAKQHQVDVLLDGARIKLFTVGGARGVEPEKPGQVSERPPGQEGYERPTAAALQAAAGLEVRFPAKAGIHVVGVAFLDETSVPEGVIRPRLAGVSQSFLLEPDPAVDSVAIGGPYDAKGLGETPSRSKIFVCRPTGSNDEEACAKRILSALARRAYRRPVTDGDLKALLSSYETGRREGDFEAGIKMALERILVGPEFLFRTERSPANAAPGGIFRISDLELASRLSFFLWSSIPDDQLLDLAARGRLKDPMVLEQQVRRMLGDARSKALMSNFAGQWLQLRTMRAVAPDPGSFPYFDENLREGLQQETELFFESMLRENHSVLDLLTANYSFFNERVAKHYGIPNVYGSHFRRVILSDENRKGLLGKGSILTVTSYPGRTSPVLRGKWVLENILGTPPPPPPANVPALKDDQNTKTLTMRQRMEQHRANPVCAGCHARMDPLGFALENFDGIGQWRNATETNTPIDSSGALPDGTKFQGPAELQKILLSHPEQFVATVTEKLLTYSLGRQVEFYDEPAIRKIMRGAAPNYRWDSLILGIVKSTPFQMRRSAEL